MLTTPEPKLPSPLADRKTQNPTEPITTTTITVVPAKAGTHNPLNTVVPAKAGTHNPLNTVVPTSSPSFRRKPESTTQMSSIHPMNPTNHTSRSPPAYPIGKIAALAASINPSSGAG